MRCESNPFLVEGKKFHWANNPHFGKLDLWDAEGNHIGQAPNLEEAIKFLRTEIAEGRLK